MNFVCYYCGSNNTKVYKMINGFSLYKCGNCSLVQTNLHGLSLRRINIKKYTNIYLNNYENILSKMVQKNFRKRIGQINRLSKGGRILDFGCSTGLFLRNLKQYSRNSWDIYGVDVNEKSIDRAQRHVAGNFYNKPLKDIKFPANYFDCITCFDVLEHDIDLHNTIKKIYRIINKSGVVLVQVPNYKSLLAFLTGDKWDWWCLPDHVFHFDAKTIEKILLINKFKIIYKSTWSYSHIFIENIRGSIKNNISNRILKTTISKLLYVPIIFIWLISLITDKVLNTGGLVTIIAQKQ